MFPQALEWIHDTGEFYLSTHTSTGSSIHHTQELLKEHEDFQITAKVYISFFAFEPLLFKGQERVPLVISFFYFEHVVLVLISCMSELSCIQMGGPFSVSHIVSILGITGIMLRISLCANH